MASAETVHDLLLLVETTVRKKWLPVDTVRVNMLPAETLDSKQNHVDRLGHLSCTAVSVGRERSWTFSAEAKYDGSLRRKRKLADSFLPCVLNYDLGQKSLVLQLLAYMKAKPAFTAMHGPHSLVQAVRAVHSCNSW